MKKTWLTALAAALLLAGSYAPAMAQEMNTVAVVSIAGYDELLDDVDFLGAMAENQNTRQQIEGMLALFTQGQGLAGVNKQKPWGVIVQTDGQTYPVIGFIPVDDLDQLFGILAGFVGQPADKGDGVFEIAGPMPIFVKHQNGWAFIGRSQDELATTPDDPAALLGGLPSEYDIAAQLNVQEVPLALREMLIAQVQAGASQQLQSSQQVEGLDPELQRAATQRQIDALAQMINESSQITLGLRIDRESEQVYADFQMTAVPGSKMAAQMAITDSKPTAFAGFLLPDALATAHINSAMDPASPDTEQAASMVSGLAPAIKKEISEEGLDEQTQEIVESIVDDVIDVFASTIKAGHVNGGAVVAGDGPFTAVAGATVADSAKLETAVKKMLQLIAKDGSMPADALKLDASESQGLRFHTLSFPTPMVNGPRPAMAKELLGDEVNVVVGFSATAVFAAVGPDAMATIDKVVAASTETPPSGLPPMQLTVGLNPIVKFAAEQHPEDANLSMLASGLQDGDDDQVLLTETMIENGLRYRLLAEKGVIKLLSALGRVAAARSGVGAF